MSSRTAQTPDRSTRSPELPKEQLRRLVYTSTAHVPFTSDQLQSLLIKSRQANAQRGITGMLLYRQARFIQVLEGSADGVEALVNSILHDSRHGDVRILWDEETIERQFASWTMGFQPLSPRGADLPSGFRDSFDDLASLDEHGSRRALRELTLWFTVRSRGDEG